MISVLVVSLRHIEPIVEVFLESVEHHLSKVTEVIIADKDKPEGYSEVKQKGRLRIVRFGSPGGDQSDAHCIGLHGCLKRVTNPYILISDPDIFFFSGVDEIYLDLLTKHNLFVVGISVDYPKAVAQDYFPIPQNFLIKKSSLPPEKWLRGTFRLKGFYRPPQITEELFAQEIAKYNKNVEIEEENRKRVERNEQVFYSNKETLGRISKISPEDTFQLEKLLCLRYEDQKDLMLQCLSKYHKIVDPELLKDFAADNSPAAFERFLNVVEEDKRGSFRNMLVRSFIPSFDRINMANKFVYTKYLTTSKEFRTWLGILCGEQTVDQVFALIDKKLPPAGDIKPIYPKLFKHPEEYVDPIPCDAAVIDGDWLLPGAVQGHWHKYPNVVHGGTFDTCCGLYLWCQEINGKWIAFQQSGDGHTYRTGYCRSNFGYRSSSNKYLLYHLLQGTRKCITAYSTPPTESAPETVKVNYARDLEEVTKFIEGHKKSMEESDD